MLTIKTNNGASYTEQQVKKMFDMQIQALRNNVCPSDKARLEKWINEGNEH